MSKLHSCPKCSSLNMVTGCMERKVKKGHDNTVVVEVEQCMKCGEVFLGHEAMMKIEQCARSINETSVGAM